MTRFSSAATAETQQSWAKVLRITEVAAGLPPSQPSVQSSPAKAMLDKLQPFIDSARTGLRWIARKRSEQLAAKRLRVAETISLGEKRTVSIVVVDGAQFLIGSSASGVQLLTRLDAAAAELPQNERAL